MGLLVTEELLTFRGPFLPFLPPCDIIRLFKMIVCIKYLGLVGQLATLCQLADIERKENNCLYDRDWGSILEMTQKNNQPFFPLLTRKIDYGWKWELWTFLCKQIVRHCWPPLTSIFPNQRSTSCSVFSKKRWGGQWWRDSWNQMINILFAAFKAKLLQNSALRTSRCFRPFTILK